ncbi:MAG: hypothetical protein OXC96_10310 [Cyanobacteria bacterium MAG CAR1_bin_15]|nr:hypothetical protein [Cyanobacteria bacterium MAG CAR1_bin_15]
MTQEQELNVLKDRILEALRSAPEGRLTKADLRREFQSALLNDLYQEAEQALVDDKVIERCRGRSGGVCLLPEANSQSQGPESSASAAEESSQPERQGKQERDYYVPVLQQIEMYWTRTQLGCKAVFGAVTAHQGRRSTGGRWTRPDITFCTVSEWIFSSRPEGEVRTIEVKRFEDLNVLGVHEALSHKSSSHYAYLIIVNFPEKLPSDKEQDFDRTMAAAAKYGIGLIKVPSDKCDDSYAWDFLLEPTRSDADHQEIHNFLLNQFPKDKRDQFEKAVRQ